MTTDDLYASRGRVSTMPGSVHELPEGTKCDSHEDRLAVKRIQGETDSFGCEYVMLCQECLDAYHKFREEERNTPRYCDWCKQQKLHVSPHRDVDEGMAGPVYNVCRECKHAEAELFAKEYEENHPFGNDDFDWADDPFDPRDSDSFENHSGF